jgi:hypothetical protein
MQSPASPGPALTPGCAPMGTSSVASARLDGANNEVESALKPPDTVLVT